MKQVDTIVLYGAVLQEISILDNHIVLLKTDKNRYYAIFHQNVYEKASKVFYQSAPLHAIRNIPITNVSLVHRGPEPSRENPMVEKDEVIFTLEARPSTGENLLPPNVAVFTFELSRELSSLDDRYVCFYEITEEEFEMFRINMFHWIIISNPQE